MDGFSIRNPMFIFIVGFSEDGCLIDGWEEDGWEDSMIDGWMDGWEDSMMDGWMVSASATLCLSSSLDSAAGWSVSCSRKPASGPFSTSSVLLLSLDEFKHRNQKI